MTAAKGTGIAAVFFRKRKPVELPTGERQVKAARLLKASEVEDVRAKLESIQGMLDSFEQELVFIAAFNAGMERFLVAEQKMGLSEEKLMSEGRIADLDHDIESMIDGLHKQIPALRSSKEISDKIKKQLTKLQDRYIDNLWQRLVNNFYI